MKANKNYVGIHNEIDAGMTDTARIIRDAWAFGLIPEDETCEGWNAAGIQQLWDKVAAWRDEHGFLVRHYPPEVQERYLRIQEAAVIQARKDGWDPELSENG